MSVIAFQCYKDLKTSANPYTLKNRIIQTEELGGAGQESCEPITEGWLQAAVTDIDRTWDGWVDSGGPGGDDEG